MCRNAAEPRSNITSSPVRTLFGCWDPFFALSVRRRLGGPALSICGRPVGSVLRRFGAVSAAVGSVAGCQRLPVRGNPHRASAAQGVSGGSTRSKGLATSGFTAFQPGPFRTRAAPLFRLRRNFASPGRAASGLVLAHCQVPRFQRFDRPAEHGGAGLRPAVVRGRAGGSVALWTTLPASHGPDGHDGPAD